MSSNIITVTLSPSIDVTLWVNALDRDAVNRVEHERREAGGKGINVSRVLSAFGVNNLCIALAGRENSKEFAEYLLQSHLDYDLVYVDGVVRENLTLRYDEETVKINRAGVELSTLEIAVLMQYIVRKVRPGDVVVFGGSLPRNMTSQDYAELIFSVKNAGAVVVIDSDFLSFEQYARLKPWLIKPNRHELAAIVPQTEDSEQAIQAAAQKLVEAGVENVLVSMGEDGLMLVNADGITVARSPRVVVKSTVGAGDSALAGFLIGYTRGTVLEDCVRMAAACGTATVTCDGTGLGDAERVEQLLTQVKVERL